MAKFRHEEKIKISRVDFYILKSRLSKVFSPDEHVGPDGFYTIKSLYFDDDKNSALLDKVNGVNIREKFRIRTYEECDGYFLEKKAKVNSLCKKVKVSIEEEKVKKILEGEYDFLRTQSKLELELYSKITGNRLHPLVIVSYKRIPFVYAPGNVRITLDYDIRADYVTGNFTDKKSSGVPTGGDLLMEVKWDEFLPDTVRSAIGIGTGYHQAFSKYATGRMYG